MSEISRFFGIVITMYWEGGGQHNSPHFHVRFGEHRASYSIDPVAQLAGALPIRQQRLVEAWVELHQDELMKNWELMQHGRRPSRIRGLE